ncbi:hypothetical protein LCGC14_1061090, partial [marine sediment metagenome]
MDKEALEAIAKAVASALKADREEL